MPLSAASRSRMQGIIDDACADPINGVPGAAFVIIDNKGDELLAHAAGKRGVVSKEPATLDNVFWIASCTKMLTGVACMQLVEQGVLKLDDGDQVEGLCPELKEIKVLKEDGSLEEKNKKITLRMLLTHTSGFGYTFFNEKLRDWSLPTGVDEFSGRIEDIKLPLVFQPGEGWEYGLGIDWAGLALERATGLKLNDYLQRNVFAPVGAKDISMIPSAEMRSKLMHMHTREHDGTARPRDHLLRKPLIIDPDNASEVESVFNSGGAGIFAKPQEYCKVLAVLLNNGTCPRTGAQLLKPETVDEMFRNQIPEFPNFARQGIPASKPDQTNEIPQIYAVPNDPPQGWGLTFMLSNGGATGRSKGTGHWAGLANLYWWCDRENGVAGIVCTQVLPFVDGKVVGMWAAVESELYKAIS